MNPLFTLPLHGLACEPFCAPNNENIFEKLQVDFNKIDFDESLQPLWSLTDTGERYQSEVTLYKEQINKELTASNGCVNEGVEENHYLKINCQGNGLFKINEHSITIDWQANGTDSAHYFQTLAAALYLELKNILCIHANALAYKNHAVALVAPSRTGKTTLTAALSQQGFGLMTDDMMALHYDAEKNDYTVYPSWPVARMWPDSLADLVGDDSASCKKVHDKFSKRIVTIDNNENSSFNFCSTPKKLKVIYLLQRHSQVTEQSDAEAFCTISNIPAAEALVILLQNSILGSAYSALKIEKTRVMALATLLNNIQFKQISYSSGKANLLNIGNKIKQDLTTIVPS